MIDVKFAPDPRLSSTQRATTARELRMRDGTKTVTVRKALLFYPFDEMKLLAAFRRLDQALADPPVGVRNARHVAV